MKTLQKSVDVSKVREGLANVRKFGGSYSPDAVAKLCSYIDALEVEVARLREAIGAAIEAYNDRNDDDVIAILSTAAKNDSSAPVSRPQAGEDVVERFTPNEIIMLLHFYCSAAPFDRIHAPACQAAVQRFLAAGWIEPSNKSGNQYHTTAAGTVMVNAICRITSTDRERGLEEARKALEAIVYECGSMSDEHLRGVVKGFAEAGLARSLKRSQEKG